MGIKRSFHSKEHANLSTFGKLQVNSLIEDSPHSLTHSMGGRINSNYQNDNVDESSRSGG